LFSTLSRRVLGDHPDDVIWLHPVAVAGWFGMFVTFLNLLPIGQLDGGHVIYALFGRRHRIIARLSFLVVIGLGVLGWQGWFLWAFLLGFVVRVDHPDTQDSDTPLDPFRKFAAWCTIGVFVVTFMPVPLSVLEAVPGPAPMHREMQRPPRPGDRHRFFDRDGSLMDIRFLDSASMPAARASHARPLAPHPA
jgi:hypothetical protein